MHGMRPFGALLSKEDALARLLAAAPPVARAETVPLAQARGRVLAEAVRAGVAVPPFARATMDGYAVRASDGASLRVGGDVFAGARAPSPLGPGEARRIATGAPLPPGADAVARVEDTQEDDGRVTLRAPVRPGLFVDPAGSDLPAGGAVVEAGALLTPARLGLLASVGLAEARVFERPRVSLFSSGDELLQPGEPADPWRIYDSNGASLRALFETAGGAVAREPSLPDDLDALRRALREAAARSHLVVFTGGASVGAKDLVADAVRAEGEILFHGVRVKPGKPLLAGCVGGALVVGLPGNPTSALSNACVFLVPTLRRMARLPDAQQEGRPARLARAVKAEGDRFLFLPVRLEGGLAVPTFKGSGLLTSMAASDGWVGVPEGSDLPEGAPVVVHPW